MGNEGFGEHSRKKDDNESEERPFKKARYVWQLKGKYHLKKHYKSEKNKSNDSSEGSSRNSSYSDNTVDIEQNNNNNNNNEPEENNNTCRSRCCIDSILAQSNAIMESDDFEQEVSSSNIDRSLSEEIPVSLVQVPKNKDDLLYKWQARQVAKSFVDNTINTILEHCKLAPFDATDIIENCENGEKVEDEGILMAIQSHGLQSNSTNSFSTNVSCFPSNSTQVPCFPSGPSNTSQSSSEKFQHIDESALDNFENTQNEIVKQSHASENVEELACDLNGENEAENNSDMRMEDPMDFLNAAVTVAIQKKGLSSYNYG